MSETKIQLNERKIRNGARRGIFKGERTMRDKTWKKLKSTKKRKIKFCAPPHFTRNKTDDGYVLEGTDKPYDPSAHTMDEYTIWIDDPFAGRK